MAISFNKESVFNLKPIGLLIMWHYCIILQRVKCRCFHSKNELRIVAAYLEK